MRSKEKSLDHEVRAFNIRVSLIEPAYTRSAFDQNALEPDAKFKNYDQARAGTHALLQDVMPKADPPELVADVVLRAATDRRPQRRYTAGKIARQISLLRRFAPAQMFDKSLRKQLRLPVRKTSRSGQAAHGSSWPLAELWCRHDRVRSQNEERTSHRLSTDRPGLLR